MSKQRLDKALVELGLASSRTRAGALIGQGHVKVDGVVVTKSSATVSEAHKLTVTHQDLWVSRAAHKLLGALETFPEVRVEDRRCLDAGASTGGFTQVLLTRGAEEVVAADVGHDQLAPVLRQDARVRNIEGLNLRYVEPGDLGEPFQLIVADLSFISLKLIVGPLAGQAAPGADLVLMVKPQFEIGKDRLGRTGVVTSAQLRREAVAGVVAAAERAGLSLQAAARSSLAGQDGNAEFFLHLRKPAAGGAVEDSTALTGTDDRLSEVDFHDPAPAGSGATDPQS